ncbi:MAG TPA: bifunctional metallophosphatase/5'-nucleotidase [Candidatus Faecalibacterium intestinigallinarum]|uniref:Bifunctional metallophosphatase/5'-nucleotidase n=1 Tax=Candidatus Faecalibacterium intestinigallinarum TaxID=2838581 RepID=A0A9D1TX44_9FIRM|nr:bifunctional metallophosphatase/5'-nucleotidase [Candidatus Faecalibacterium intestinigallinarum]
MKNYISRRNFLKAAGAMTGAAAALGLTAAPLSADGLFYPLVAPDKHPITILYTNDVHTYIDNEAPELTYANIAALKKSYEDADMDVLLVDAGDHIQGTAYGAMDDGATIIKLMNSAGYDLATLGNHEFDYGMDRILEIVNEEANFPYVSCNFKDLRTGKKVLPSIKYFFRGGRILAFIGVTTPETITKSTPAYFMDAAQTEYIYGIDGGDDGQALYDAVQKAIDEAWLYADFVIGLGHLGVDGSSKPYTSREVIQHTVGFNAFIDGHSHTEIPGETVRDAEGNPVLLTQTGCYLGNIGRMTIDTDRNFTTELIPSTNVNAFNETYVLQTDWINAVDDMLGEKIAESPVNFYINDPVTGKRLIRSEETNMGDLVADGIYAYFNEIEQLDCDIAIMNGGGIRADIPAGDWTYMSCKTVSPFGNVACLMSVTGAQIQNALEFGARYAGSGQESGGFLQVAGATYEIHTDLPNTVPTDDQGVWSGPATGTPRVQNVKIYNKATGTYEPLDPNATYNMAGMNYTLRSLGDGFAMFDGATLVKDYVAEDYLVLSSYAMLFDGGVMTSANSPLADYPGYLLDYENPYGAGRITLL